MNLKGKFKYWLLGWLIDDICSKSPDDCKGCMMNHSDAGMFSTCGSYEVSAQALKVWVIKED